MSDYPHLSISDALAESTSSDCTVEVIGVVLSMEIKQNCRNETNILIGDDTIQQNTCIRVSTNLSQRVQKFNISRGDVVQIRGLQIMKRNNSLEQLTDGEKLSLSVMEDQQLPTVICEFYQSSWKNPLAGEILSRLGISQVNNRDMNSRIRDLTFWFQENYVIHQRIASSSIPKKIRDIRSSNLLCSVTCKVLSYHHVSKLGSKRRKKQHQLEDTAIATLSDGTKEEDTMTLCRCKRFCNTLNNAMKQGSWVTITKLLSCSENSIMSNDDSNLQHTHGSQTVILVPSIETTINITKDINLPHSQALTQEGTYHHTGGESLLCYPDSAILPISSCSSITKKIQSKVINIKIEDNGDFYNESMELIIHSRNVTNNNNNSSTKPAFSSPEELVRGLLIDNNQEYRSVILTLTQEEEEFNVHANSNIVQALCGSVPPEKLISSLSRKEFSKVVYDILYGLIEEEIILSWEIIKYDAVSCWSVKDVKLLYF